MGDGGRELDRRPGLDRCRIHAFLVVSRTELTKSDEHDIGGPLGGEDE
jgi:hypothetical protein